MERTFTRSYAVNPQKEIIISGKLSERVTGLNGIVRSCVMSLLNCDSPDNLDCSITSNVNRLRNLRNELVHWPTVEISNEYFRTKISEIKNAIRNLGLREPEIPEPEIWFSPEEFRAALEELGDIKKEVEELENKFVQKLTTF